ncbi:MAG: C39 family peptidase [Sarcina sp.]
MKKKIIISALVIAGIVAISVGAFVYSKEKNITKVQPKIVSNNNVKLVENTKIKEKTKEIIKDEYPGEVGGKPTNYEYPTMVALGQYNSYEIPNYIHDIQKTNYDTDYYWHTPMSNINKQLNEWYEKYKIKDIKDILDNEKNIPSYLVRLAVMHPESIPYAAGYHGYKLNTPISLKGYIKEGKIPLFQQWDKQWGYDWYGNGPLAMDGCGPTSLSMIIVGLTGNMKANPRMVARYSAENGGYSWNAGSDQDLFTGVAEHYGLVPHRVSGEEIAQQLRLGRPVMVSCHAGTFTLSGHIIVLSGITQNGQIVINNPDSIKDSMKTWSLQTILDNMNYAYSYSAKK